MKALRTGENISPNLLSRMLDIPESRLLAIENTTVLPNIKELLAIAAFFNRTTDYLLGREAMVGVEEAIEKHWDNGKAVAKTSPLL